jgi:hypothetical protein
MSNCVDPSKEKSRPPRLRGGTPDLSAPLTPAEGFVLSRIDGSTTLAELSQLTGLSGNEVGEIVRKLEGAGFLESSPAEPTAEGGTELFDDLAGLAAASETPADDEEGPERASPPPSSGDPIGTTDELVGRGRRRWETELRHLGRDERIARARVARGDDLAGFCLDPDPAVIRAILENDEAGLPEARLIAAHHVDPDGLGALVRRSDFSNDDSVRRLLYRNHQLTEALLRRLLGSRPLREIHRVASSREVADRSLGVVRSLFRERFLQVEPGERVEILFASEGRVLSLLIGLALDEATAALFCRRSCGSVAMIRNLASFPGMHPQMVVHLLRQPVVSRTPHLRRALLAHPNCPSRMGRKE